MKTTSTPSYRLFLLYLLLTFYCLGAAVMNEFVEYQSWADLGPYLSAADFAAWHVATSQHALPFLTVPALFLTVVVLALFWDLPPAIPRWPLYVVAACHALSWASSVLVQFPLEARLSQGEFSPELMNYLIHSDWLRKLTLFVEAPMAAYMAHRALHGAAAPAGNGVQAFNKPALG
ncbi:hypothetical protein [Hymenobacter latericus]|uniref:hypothetical protein n=1 Tax=Hymenobacter sp. YIM 151858-1 TaxID=2987688 RepID=UPI00222699FD|nr:hypothetical protein [Hymenobacter sp. YIM 151858-1]UYZ57623.1 hypothetical protein OIS50_11135 [Hymenobacter sp. YIM 151858-1]